MNKIDFAAINERLNADDVVPQWLPNGKRKGHEWVAVNPTRSDNKPGSFSINLNTGAWSDFATNDAGGDLVSLYAYLFHANDNAAAARKLAGDNSIAINPQIREQAAAKIKEFKKPEPVFPVPTNAPTPNFTHNKMGPPSMVHTYRDTAGNVLMYVCRFDMGGKKSILPMTYDGTRWNWSGITGTGKRPLYGLEKLTQNPDADVLIVEGEKTADAAQQILGGACVVLAWLGGTSTADKVRVSSLHNRRVILWPDFDAKENKQTGELLPMREQPGIKAMLEIAKNLSGTARETLMVGYQFGDFPDTWDLADANDWDAVRVLDFIAKNAGDPFSVAAGDVEPANDNFMPLSATVNPFGFPHLTDKGAPMNTAENLDYLLGEYGITCQYNVISKEIEINIPGQDFSQDNRSANNLATITSLCARNRMPKTELVDYITLIADQNHRNPAADYIDSKPWDGVDRLDDLTRSLDPDDFILAKTLLKRWMIGAVSAAFNPHGQAMQGVLVLQGEQGTGKTSWFWSLTGGDRQLCKEGAMLNPSDRDSVKTAISYWLVELGELDATFRKADIAALKAFITRDQDELFLRYSRAASTFPRRSAFIATVNDQQYLRDETGNRRYWSIKCGRSMRFDHGVDVQQVWAQIKQLWLDGERHPLTRDEMAHLNGANADHTEISPVEELITARFDFSAAARPVRMTATEVLLAVGYDRPNRAQTREAGQVLRKLVGEPIKSHGRQVFDLPPRFGGNNNAF